MEANATYTDTQISTHALREEGDQRRRGRSRGVRRFLPTPSARRATLYSRVRQGLHRDFYPRPPRGGRPGFFPAKTPQKEFLPTPSARRATEPRAPTAGRMKISTHALREEGDSRCGGRTPMRFYFYPRPPRGGRPAIYVQQVAANQFLPTPSARRATTFCPTDTDSDKNFYPRPPRGGRRSGVGYWYSPSLFLPTPSARRATIMVLDCSAEWSISTHALREEGDRLRQFWRRLRWSISTHALREEGD